VLQIKLKPDWPQSSFVEYHQAVKKQLGLLWSLSDDATIGNCGNLKLLWSPTRWNWLLESDGKEIGRFVLPFTDNSLIRFQKLCSSEFCSTK